MRAAAEVGAKWAPVVTVAAIVAPEAWAEAPIPAISS